MERTVIGPNDGEAAEFWANCGSGGAQNGSIGQKCGSRLERGGAERKDGCHCHRIRP